MQEKPDLEARIGEGNLDVFATCGGNRLGDPEVAACSASSTTQVASKRSSSARAPRPSRKMIALLTICAGLPPPPALMTTFA